MNDTERARSALASLDPSCPRDEWICIGMAAKAAQLSFEDFHIWSKDTINYTGEKDCLTTWKSFNEVGDVTAATLFHKARERGWKNTEKLHSHLMQTRYRNPNYQKNCSASKNVAKGTRAS